MSKYAVNVRPRKEFGRSPNRNLPILPYINELWFQTIENEFTYSEGLLFSKHNGKWIDLDNNEPYYLFGVKIYKYTIQNYFERKPWRWYSLKDFMNTKFLRRMHQLRSLKVVRNNPIGWCRDVNGDTIWIRPTPKLIEFAKSRSD